MTRTKKSYEDTPNCSGITPKEKENWENGWTRFAREGVKTERCIGDLADRSYWILPKYSFPAVRGNFFKDRHRGDGLKGRFKSEEERLNAIEDEMLLNNFIFNEWLTELEEDFESFKHDFKRDDYATREYVENFWYDKDELDLKFKYLEENITKVAVISGVVSFLLAMLFLKRRK